MWFNQCMTCEFKTIALIGKYQSPEVAEAVLRLANYLRGLGIAVLIEQGTASSTGLTAGFRPLLVPFLAVGKSLWQPPGSAPPRPPCRKHGRACCSKRPVLFSRCFDCVPELSWLARTNKSTPNCWR